MKKRVLCVALAAILLLAIPSIAAADSSGVCFTAVGDRLLDLSSMPSFVGGAAYLPSRVFSSFGVYYNYFDSDATALLYNGSKQIFFGLNDGSCYDSEGTTYQASAVLRNGQVYVPAAWVCQYFGLSYSYISGSGNGDIVRIKNGSEVLTDSKFIDAATSLMKMYYTEYYGMIDPATPSPSPTLPSENDDNHHSSAHIFLTFIGVPDSKLLDELDRFAYQASFFVTAQEAEENADTLRRIYGSGHNIGIFCESSVQDCEKAAVAIYNACQTLPTMLSSDTALATQCIEYGKENALAYFSPTISAPSDTAGISAISSRLEEAAGYLSICVEISSTTSKMLPSLFYYLSSNSFNVLPLRETYL